jgi:hypothetical protein
MASWPDELYGTILKSGYNETVPNNVIRTEMDVGPAKIRRRGTAAVRPFTFNLFLSPAQLATFDTFYVTTIKSGSLSFTFRSPRTQVIGDYQFVAPPSYNPSDQGYIVSCQLELLP